jgi:O-antigen ligase
MGLATVMAIGAAVAAPRARLRTWFVLAAAICVVGLFLSLSRGGILAAAIGLLVVSFTRSRLAGIGVVLVMAVAGAIAYPIFLESRLEQTFGAASTDAYLAAAQSEESRVLAVTGGVRLWLSAPLFGVGFGRFQALSPPFITGTGLSYPHNWYLRILAEQGVIGALLVAVVAIALTVALYRSRHTLRGVALGMVASVATFSLFGEPVLGLQSTGILWLTAGAALAAYSGSAARLPAIPRRGVGMWLPRPQPPGRASQ